MKLTVKTLKGSHFEIQVQPSDTVIAVKKVIEEVQRKDNYPWGQQLLIHSGKVLKDETTLEESKVTENGFLVVMLSKTSAVAPTSRPPEAPSSQPTLVVSPAQPAPASLPPQQASADTSVVAPTPAGEYGPGATSLIAGRNVVEPIVQQLLEMGGGTWDKNTVLQALRAAYNNPERAVEYLYSGIPASAEVAIPAINSSNSQSGQGTQTTEAALTGIAPMSGVPNTSPLNMFPQEVPSLAGGVGGGTLDFLRQNQQFQALRAMVQDNPQILQPLLQELAKQNPQLLRLIQEHHAEFLQLLNEPVEGVDEGDMFEPDQEMPHAITVTQEEQEAIGRLEAMGFDRARVLEAFLACDRNEELVPIIYWKVPAMKTKGGRPGPERVFSAAFVDGILGVARKMEFGRHRRESLWSTNPLFDPSIYQLILSRNHIHTSTCDLPTTLAACLGRVLPSYLSTGSCFLVTC